MKQELLHTRKIPTLIADSSRLNVELLSAALGRCQNYFEVVAHALNSADAQRLLIEFVPAIALISAELQDGPTAGFQVLQHIRANHPRSSAVALLNDSRRELVLEAFRCGARGVVSREQPFRVIAKCLRKVHQGEFWASNDQIGFVLGLLHQESQAPPAPSGITEQLTPREREVAALVAEGMINAQIAARLGISENTIRNYVMRIYDKLGVSNRVQLARRCAAGNGG